MDKLFVIDVSNLSMKYVIGGDIVGACPTQAEYTDMNKMATPRPM